ncbi:MAG: aspartate aminotransferase [Mesoaciditoga sp.]|uniref:aspartate aminotransferase n=2 Tax=Athalassotoga sp. TaxID=2022597 RepID=UPI000CA8FE3E|nr:MAG: aspartate aminotransferase [Mesoaciditoga sp.]HEU23915.1 pyridoxal phosphate-dependent aminotransferase [Mesoaciditoga lauensis]
MSGLSSIMKNIKTSTTLKIDNLAKEMKKAGNDVVLFTAGEPDFPTPQPIKDAAKSAIDANFTKYTNSNGIEELRDAISKKLRNENGLFYNPDQIVVSNGGKQALFNAFGAILEPGDEVIVIAPAWVSYVPQIEMWKGKPVILNTYPENEYIPSISDFEKLLTSRTKAILMNSPNNPTGAVYPKETIEMIANFVKKHDLFVVTDEIYEKLSYDLPHVSIGSFDEMRDRTITINGFSKSYAMTGWRIGYCAGPSNVIKEISKIQSHTTSNVNSITQIAAVKALEVDTSYMVKEFRERRDLISDLLKDTKLKFFKPKGAFYVMIDLRDFLKGKSTEELCLDMIKQAGVAVIPADDFYAPGFARISFSTSKEEIKKGIARIKNYLKF